MKLRFPEKHTLHNIEFDYQDELTGLYYKPYAAWFYRGRYQWVARKLGLGPFDQLLEIGTGAGVFIPHLSAISKQSTHIDLHQELSAVQKSFQAWNVEDSFLLSADLLNMPFSSDVFDAVICLSVLEHLQPGELDSTLNGIQRVAAKQSKIVLGFPVTTKFTDAIFNVYGRFFAKCDIDIKQHHFSTQHDIIAAVDRIWKTYNVHRFPYFMLTPFTMYNFVIIDQTE